MTVIGVVRDFHVKSYHSAIAPMMITMDPERFGTLAVRIMPQNQAQILEFLRETWERVLPFAEFSAVRMEDAYESMYRTEDDTGVLIFIFTGLALAVSCLGLFGLASFTTANRTKEIGVRKTLGASSGSITALLTGQMIKWVVLANLIAWPAAAWLVGRWLENFAYRIDLSLAPFVLSGAAALIIAALTVSFQAVKAALRNPVESLRYE
jgi:putative ABC transport system permease protein